MWASGGMYNVSDYGSEMKWFEADYKISLSTQLNGKRSILAYKTIG
jgi:hypothetical protein